MELTDLMPLNAWEGFEKELYDHFHINCTVYNTAGVSITGKHNWCNKLCPKIKANKDSLAAICAPGNQHFMAQAKQTHQAVIGECDAGLLKIAVPIFVGDTFLGTAGGCGLLPEGGEVEDFLVQKTTGMRPEEIEACTRELDTMTPQQAQEMAAYIEQHLADFIQKSGV